MEEADVPPVQNDEKHTMQDDDFTKFFKEVLKTSSKSFDKRLLAALIFKHKGEVTAETIQNAFKRYLGIKSFLGNSEFARVRRLFDFREKLPTPAPAQPGPAPSAPAPKPTMPAPIAVAIPVVAPVVTQPEVSPLKVGDQVEAISGDYFGAIGEVVRFGHSKRDMAPGTLVRPASGGRDFWTDTTNLRKVVK